MAPIKKGMWGIANEAGNAPDAKSHADQCV